MRSDQVAVVVDLEDGKVNLKLKLWIVFQDEFLPPVSC